MNDPIAREKRAAALGAVALVDSGMVVGLGSGSTAALAIQALGRRIESGELRDIVGVPTSNEAHRLALECGVPVVDIEKYPGVDITIDGADEIDPVRHVLKGGGGALLREKIVAARSARWVIIADSTKLVQRIGERYAVPVEVVRFGWSAHVEVLQKMGAHVKLRAGDGGTPFVSDEGHYIIDARFPDGVEDPHALARTMRERPGVVETGLFLDFDPEVIVGREALE